ncbi:sel1 repeat family protein [Helicobacter muridarum]|uniref:Beta-lactamase n=1 Tax=Helicobacter muridarum TaxID=216 RepID=A0A377PRF8_9HELI|nr:tetratricopeptide repeat protein [Helicobacter muridarum]TLD99018.1 sel1 repeat family protein [Helicobacter muridarum]STQ85416.1 secreted protein [Helicobacter muridarum]
MRIYTDYSANINKLWNYLRTITLIFYLILAIANTSFSKDSKTRDEREERIACIIDYNKDTCIKLISKGLQNVNECNVENECGILAMIYYHAGRDNEALPYLTRIRDASELRNYNQLGMLQRQNKDYVNAKKNFELACQKGYIMGCFNLGVLYENGLGVKRDYNRAIELYEDSCNSKIGIACYGIAVLYFNGQVNVKIDSNISGKKAMEKLIAQNNMEQAKVYFTKACEIGYEDACEWSNRLKKQSNSK